MAAVIIVGAAIVLLGLVNFDRLTTLRCEHKRTYNLYGDAILQTLRAWRTPSLARVRCADCGRALYDREMNNESGIVEE